MGRGGKRKEEDGGEEDSNCSTAGFIRGVVKGGSSSGRISSRDVLRLMHPGTDIRIRNRALTYFRVAARFCNHLATLSETRLQGRQRRRFGFP